MDPFGRRLVVLVLLSAGAGASTDAGQAPATGPTVREVALVPLPGIPPEGRPRRPWVVGSGPKTFTVSNAGPTPRTERWEVTVRVGAKDKPLAKASVDEKAVGAVMIRGALVLAVHGPDQTEGTFGERLRAVDALARGDGTAAAKLAGPPRGALLVLDAAGAVAQREPIEQQRPAGLAVTADGWLVLLTEGTLARGLRDAQLLGRPPGARTGWKLLASDLEMPGQVTGAGSWVCVSEMPGADDRVAHCVDPGRSLWVKSPPLQGNLFLRDVSVGKGAKLVLHHQEYVNHVAVDHFLALPLP